MNFISAFPNRRYPFFVGGGSLLFGSGLFCMCKNIMEEKSCGSG